MSKFDPKKDIHQGPISARSQRKNARPSQEEGSSQSHSQMTFDSINNRTIDDVPGASMPALHSNSFDLAAPAGQATNSALMLNQLNRSVTLGPSPSMMPWEAQ